MADFTSALYLGMRHPGWALHSWDSFTTGKPATLEVPPEQVPVTRCLGRLVGCERATLGSSTLHLFSDLLPMLGRCGMSVYIDNGAYPIAGWSAERVLAAGMPLQRFAHYDPIDLERRMEASLRKHKPPVVVADGLCPECGRPAPVLEYLSAVRPRGGLLVLDDTQALGIMGRTPVPTQPYGFGGGGSFPFHGVGGDELIAVSSLAKGFGVPMAMMAGNLHIVEWFEAQSQIRQHCSPPSLPVIYAAARALTINDSQGDRLRRSLARRVHYFRESLIGMGISVAGGLFPVQTVTGQSGWNMDIVLAQLRRRNIKAVFQKVTQGRGIRLKFLITVQHSRQEIDSAIEALSAIERFHQPETISRGVNHDKQV